jgi:hypothetical protein
MKLPATKPTRSGRLRRPAGVALCIATAVCATLVSLYSVSVMPPGLQARHLDVAGASTLVVVDRPRPLVSDDLATDGDYRTLQKRAVLLGNLMTSPPAMSHIAHRAGIDQRAIAVVTRITANVQSVLTEPDSERRTSDIRDSNLAYRLEVQPHPTLPSLNVYAQAPTVAEAQRLADSAVPGLLDLQRELAARERVAPRQTLRIEQVGRARGAIINGGNRIMIAGLTFVFAFAMAAALLAIVARLRRPARPRGAPRSAAREDRPATGGAVLQRAAALPAVVAEVATPVARPLAGLPAAARHQATPAATESRRAVAPAGFRGLATAGTAPGLAVAALAPAGAIAVPIPIPSPHPVREAVVAASRRAASAAGDWPRTTRLLPWLIAVMMAVVWLVPFNVIQLNVSLPIDLKFDRLVLPFLVGTWLMALCAGGPCAPRVRMTWIHVGVLAMMAAACLSLVVDARYLNGTLEFDTAVKKLTLLMSYVSLFFVVASVVRPTEVHAFMSYTLGLAVLCAIGTIWEYRFQYNVFYALSDQLLPGIFQVGLAESSAVDSIGRRVVRGPAELPLEAVAMVTMGLPVALVRLIGSEETRKRMRYGLAATLMLAAAIATYRKSAFIAPISVILALAYFRRRELLRLAPLGVVIAVMIPIISPGALQAVASQLSGNRLDVPTVSDRSSDYDAVRPDVWTHLAFGRGYGSYEHTSYRILDMELLRQLVEVGALGLAAYLFMIGAIVGVARGPIRARGPTEAPVALAAAAAAVGFVVISTLFDVMSFPHSPYLLLFMAALLAVVVTGRQDDEEGQAAAWRS